jgi:hypothetical protein
MPDDTSARIGVAISDTKRGGNLPRIFAAFTPLPFE